MNNLLIKVEYGQPKSKNFFKKILNKSTEQIELDTNILVYDEFKHKLDVVNYSQRCSYDCAIMHKDSETISINLKEVSPEAKFIAIVVNSYERYKFDDIPYIKLSICTDDSKVIKCHSFENDESFKNKEAIILGYFCRKEDEWKFTLDGTTFANGNISKISYKTKTNLN